MVARHPSARDSIESGRPSSKTAGARTTCTPGCGDHPAGKLFMLPVDRVRNIGSLVVFIWLSCASLVSAQSSGLFKQDNSASAVASPPAALPDRAAGRSRAVTVELSQLGSRDTSADRATTLELNLFEDTSFTAVLNRIDPTPRGFVWSGHIPALPMSTV